MLELRKDLDRIHGMHQRKIETDPIYFPHQYLDPKDQEIVAFISAMYAFGQVKAIFGTLKNIFSFLGAHPHKKLISQNKKELENYPFAKHRWVSSEDTRSLLRMLQVVLNEYPNLESSFLAKVPKVGDRLLELDMEQAMISWMDDLKKKLTQFQEKPLSRGQKFLLASPKSKSTSKRLMMFLRWMVRDEYPDLGLWKKISASQLFIPLDVHLYRFSKYLGFTRRKQPNWTTVVEVTKKFRDICPEDPIKYDFALARLGIMNLCVHKADPKYCDRCPIQTYCGLWRQHRIKLD